MIKRHKYNEHSLETNCDHNRNHYSPLVGFIPSGRFDMLLNILISFVCSLQVESFRKVNGKCLCDYYVYGEFKEVLRSIYITTKETKDKTNT